MAFQDLSKKKPSCDPRVGKLIDQVADLKNLIRDIDARQAGNVSGTNNTLHVMNSEVDHLRQRLCDLSKRQNEAETNYRTAIVRSITEIESKIKPVDLTGLQKKIAWLEHHYEQMWPELKEVKNRELYNRACNESLEYDIECIKSSVATLDKDYRELRTYIKASITCTSFLMGWVMGPVAVDIGVRLWALLS